MKFAALAAAVLIAACPAVAQAPEAAPPAYATVSGEAFQADSGGAVLVDVREPAEWAASGVPAGARQVSISRPDFVEAVLAELGGDKDKPVALICRSGARSARAAQALVDAGFTRVTNVGDGMIGRDGVGQGWQAAGLPTEPCESC